MFLRLPQRIYNKLVKIANTEGKSASFFIVESVQKRINEITSDKKQK